MEVTKAANILSDFAAAEIKTMLVGKKCWHAGSTFASTVGLGLGRKILREKPLRNKRDPDLMRYDPEVYVIFWCSWRLENGAGPLVSCDASMKVCEEKLDGLVGRTIQTVAISPTWDLRIGFSGGLALTAFPDHVGASPAFDGNWEVWGQDQAYLIGTDLACKVMDRHDRPMQLRPRQGRWSVAEKATPRKAAGKVGK